MLFHEKVHAFWEKKWLIREFALVHMVKRF